MRLLIIAFVILIIMFFVWKISNKIHIKYRTFKEKGFKPIRGNFGVYCYNGKQGRGKTYSLVEYLLDNKEDIVVFNNIKDVQNLNYFYYTGFQELIYLKEIIDYNYTNYEDLLSFINSKFKNENRSKSLLNLIIDLKENKKQLVFTYDEIFTELRRGSILSKDVLDFLCQMRKRQIIFLTTCQEWAEIPIGFRRFCRYRIDCNMIPFLFTGLLFKVFYDAENMKWSNDEQDFVAPLVETTLSKCRYSVANSYDTFLRISSVSVTPPSVTRAEENENKIEREEEEKKIEFSPIKIDLSYWENGEITEKDFEDGTKFVE